MGSNPTWKNEFFDFGVLQLKYRSRGEIVSNILRVVASNKATKTRLMYGAYLSYTQIEEYLGFILQQGLISQVSETNLYQLSEKGMQYLNLSDELSQLLVAPILKGL
ncbi:MAG: winged helix-turn-helix domain-containing protein [Nitrososphaerales archaeon]